jgi:poly-gamma-glutamate synthesis protein (capsule biosynthesis protein)
MHRILRYRHKWLVMTLVVLAILVAVFLLLPAKSAAPSLKQESTAKKPTPADNTIHLVATGDWIAHDSVNTAAAKGDTYDYSPLIASAKSQFNKADIRFCNDPILNGGKALGIAGYPKFNSPTEFVTAMGDFGCNLVNLASNHSFDFSQANISASVDAWAAVPKTLAVAGENRSQAEHDTVHYFSVKGVKFAFLAYTTYINNDAPVQNDYGVNVFSKDVAAAQIAEARKQGAQVIIASMRWGTEFTTTRNSEQLADAQFLADQGINLVLGHGSHELQPVQELTGSGGNKTLVWYSLGNFLNTQLPPETLFNGIAYMDINPKTFAITNLRFLPINVHYSWTAAQAAAQDTNARTDVKLYLLKDVTQAMIDSQQLKTTVAEQKQRLTTTLNTYGLTIPLVDSAN